MVFSQCSHVVISNYFNIGSDCYHLVLQIPKSLININNMVGTGRLACTLCPEELTEACSYPKKSEGKVAYYVEPSYISNSYEYTPLYNLSPTRVVPVFADKSHFPKAYQGCSDYVIIPMRWGLLPTWYTDKLAFSNHIAKIEGVLQSPLFKPELIKNHKCVILCDGYYEWQSTRADRQPYYIYQEKKEEEAGPSSSVERDLDWLGKPVLKLAGIFGEKVEGNGAERKYSYSCSVLTKEADESLSWLHNRMPIVLQNFTEVESWINCATPYTDSVKFLQTYKENPDSQYILKHHTVEKRFVNNPCCQNRKCMESVKVKRQLTLDNWCSSKRGPAASK